MTKIHAVGQKNYTKDYITVYIHAANFAESSTIFTGAGRITLPLSSCPHGPSCVMGDVESMSRTHSYLPYRGEHSGEG